MSPSILYPDLIAVQTPPRDGRADVLRDRARAEIIALAQELHARQIDPGDILLELHDRLGLLAEAAHSEGSRLAMRPLLPMVRAICGLPADWCPEAHARQQAATETVERRRRALVVSAWMAQHAGDYIAERAVRAVEETVADHIEEEIA